MKAITAFCLVLALGLALPAHSDETGDRKEGTGTGAAQDADQTADESSRKASHLVVYVPPSRGSTRARVGGGTRGPSRTPILSVLAPDHVGVTNRAQPSLAWFVSDATDARIDFTLVDPDAVDPLLEVTLETAVQAGVQLIRLADHDVHLEEGHSYDWSVALVVDPENRDLDVVAGAAIRREPAAPWVAGEIAAGTPPYRVLARAGVWYDALADLSEAIAADPDDAALRAERAALLEQVGVAAAAAFERE